MARYREYEVRYSSNGVPEQDGEKHLDVTRTNTENVVIYEGAFYLTIHAAVIPGAMIVLTRPKNL